MKPPLSARQRSGAWLAGAVGYGLWSTGSLLAFGILALALGTLAFGAFFGGVSWLFGGDEGLADFQGDVPTGLDVIAWTALAVGVGGVVMLVFGALGSVWILRAFRIARPAAVTWAGIGICAIPNLVLFWTIAFPISAATGLETTASIAVAVGLSAAIAMLLGALVWWWMAWAMRPAVTTDSVPAAPARAPEPGHPESSSPPASQGEWPPRAPDA